MMRTTTDRTGMTLLELIAALMIAATVAAFGIRYLRPAGETSKQRSCDMTRELLQNDAQRYLQSTGLAASTDLRELETTQFSGTKLPICPITGEAYRRDRTGTVGCPTHEATRNK